MALGAFRGILPSLQKDDLNSKSALTIIDREVEKVKSYMVTLWRQRNTFIPISRLPPEILSTIFYFVKESAAEDSLYWTKVSHVCHLWREIAINSPSLWTNPPLASIRWTEEMLSRSKMASLAVSANFCAFSHRYAPTIDPLPLILPHTPRIKSLDLCHYDHYVMQRFLSQMPESAPRLEHLRLRFAPHPQLSTSSDSVLSMNKIFEAVKLRVLELTRCALNWDSRVFGPLLVHLQMSFIPTNARPTVEQFWNAFDRMPALESIEFVDALPLTRSPGYTHPQIFLDKLRKLTISSSNSEVEIFLSGIIFPSTVAVKLSCKTGTHHDEGFRSVLTQVSSFFSSSVSRPGMKIRELDVYPSSYVMNGYSTRFIIKSSDDDSPSMRIVLPDLDLDLQTILGGIPRIICNQVVQDFCASMPLTNLVALRFGEASLLSMDTLAESFGTLPHLRSLSVSGSNAHNLVLALQKVQLHPSTNYRDTPPSLYFQSLCSISMDDIYFYDDDGDMTVGLLEDCFIWRYECGAEIHTLKLTECSRLVSSDVERLREIIVDIEWDELETGFSDEDEDEDDNDLYDDYLDDDDIYSDDDYATLAWY
ncbi:hypothetical protein CPB84DRAFT_1707887 [Gymnopilus junonius]|uniref:F-box domain-containing protein n=1 Tax=Gymnopilus junonius TaxID=109634 RepID=A0A9P5TMU5_GYMJU|nr:hypothetical protein CPB84DRAFT_1707887 [Gymnopilus junonius]